ncbi:hypothetical protein [Shimia sp.]
MSFLPFRAMFRSALFIPTVLLMGTLIVIGNALITAGVSAG